MARARSCSLQGCSLKAAGCKLTLKAARLQGVGYVGAGLPTGRGGVCFREAPTWDTKPRPWRQGRSGRIRDGGIYTWLLHDAGGGPVSKSRESQHLRFPVPDEKTNLRPGEFLALVLLVRVSLGPNWKDHRTSTQGCKAAD